MAAGGSQRAGEGLMECHENHVCGMTGGATTGRLVVGALQSAHPCYALLLLHMPVPVLTRRTPRHLPLPCHTPGHTPVSPGQRLPVRDRGADAEARESSRAAQACGGGQPIQAVHGGARGR